MRRFLLLLVACGVPAWLAAPALSLEPYAPKVIEFELSPPAGTARAASGDIVLPTIRAPRRFDLVGLRWKDAGGREIEVRLRVRRTGGPWTSWHDVGHAESGERGSPPMWTGGSDELQVRLSHRPRGLRVHFVNATGTASRTERALTTLRHAANRAVISGFGAPATAAQTRQAGAPPMVSRAQWDPENQCAPRADPGIGEVKFAMVHHTVSSNLYTSADGPSMVLAICRYHRNSNGWNDLGYNFLVDRYGTIYEGRAGGVDRAVVGAQAQGYNSVSTGISNLGTFVSGGQSPAALQANARLIAWKLGIHGAPVDGEVTVRSAGGSANRFPEGRQVTFQRVSGHRDGGETACPGAALYAQLPEIRALAKEAPAGSPAVPPAPVRGAVTLEAPARTVSDGQPVQLGGRATTPDGGGLTQAEVRVQVRTASGWQTAARTTAGDDGRWLANLATRRTRDVRVVVYVLGARAATSSALRIAVQPTIEARAARRVVVRRALTVTGRVRPIKARLTMEIARQGSDGVYRRVARVPVKVRANGTFRLTTRLRRPALHRLRVSFAGDRTNAAARSADVILRVIRAKPLGGASART